MLDNRKVMTMHEGSERVISVITANNYNNLIIFLNELELLSHAYLCVLYRVLELLDVDNLDRRYNFRELCELYLSIIEDSKLKKY